MCATGGLASFASSHWPAEEAFRSDRLEYQDASALVLTLGSEKNTRDFSHKQINQGILSQGPGLLLCVQWLVPETLSKGEPRSSIDSLPSFFKKKY